MTFRGGCGVWLGSWSVVVVKSLLYHFESVPQIVLFFLSWTLNSLIMQSRFAARFVWLPIWSIT